MYVSLLNRHTIGFRERKKKIMLDHHHRLKINILDQQHIYHIHIVNNDSIWFFDLMFYSLIKTGSNLFSFIEK